MDWKKFEYKKVDGIRYFNITKIGRGLISLNKSSTSLIKNRKEIIKEENGTFVKIDEVLVVGRNILLKVLEKKFWKNDSSKKKFNKILEIL